MRANLGGLTAVCLATASIAAQTVSAPPPADAQLLQSLTAMASPAAAGAAQPQLTANAAGRIWLSWLEPMGSGSRRFRLAELRGSAFAAALTIAEGTTLLANWADVPSVFVTSRGEIAAHWLERGAGGSYGIRLRTSRDGGQTWTRATAPHPMDSPGEHGFVSMFETPDGGLGLAWLDGRNAASHGASGGAAHGAMELRATTFVNGAPGEERVVDARVCDCCPTAATTTADGVIVAYRDRSDQEIRDIAVTRFAKGVWTPPARVHADDWQINGCPVNGPAIASSGSAVAVAWFTQATKNTPEVRVAFSKDGARTFGAATRAASGTTTGRVGVLWLDDGRVLVSSIERVGGTSSFVVREVAVDGTVGPVAVIAPMSAERSSGFPRMARDRQRVVFAWTDATGGATSQIKIATRPLR